MRRREFISLFSSTVVGVGKGRAGASGPQGIPVVGFLEQFIAYANCATCGGVPSWPLRNRIRRG